MAIEAIPGWLAFAQQASLPTLSVAALLFAVTQAIKIWPTIQKQQLESDASLRSDLLRRVEELEAEVKSVRKALDTARLSHAEDMMDMLHDLANESAQLDSAIMLAEHSPETLITNLPAIRKQRDEHRERMTLKRGTREAALLTALQQPPIASAT